MWIERIIMYRLPCFHHLTWYVGWCFDNVLDIYFTIHVIYYRLYSVFLLSSKTNLRWLEFRFPPLPAFDDAVCTGGCADTFTCAWLDGCTGTDTGTDTGSGTFACTCNCTVDIGVSIRDTPVRDRRSQPWTIEDRPGGNLSGPTLHSGPSLVWYWILYHQ